MTLTNEPRITIPTEHGDMTYRHSDVINKEDFIPTGKFNLYNVRPWLIHNELGTLAIVYASCEQDALDAAVDADKMDSCLVSQEDYLEAEKEGYADEYASLGNASEPFDLSYVGMIELPNVQYGDVTHWIAGSGSHGCLYDSCSVYESYQDAVNGLADTFELGRTRKARLFADGSLELNSGDGAEYCEIVKCTCGDPSTHDDEGSL